MSSTLAKRRSTVVLLLGCPARIAFGLLLSQVHDDDTERFGFPVVLAKVGDHILHHPKANKVKALVLEIGALSVPSIIPDDVAWFALSCLS